MPIENPYLTRALTDAIHQGNVEETQKLLKLIQEIGGVISVDVLPQAST